MLFQKYYFVVDQKKVGFIMYHYMDSLHQLMCIDYITIFRAFCGKNYSTQMFREFVKHTPFQKIQLLAKENMQKYNVLFNLYQSWGFRQIGKTSVYCDSMLTFREALFEYAIADSRDDVDNCINSYNCFKGE